MKFYIVMFLIRKEQVRSERGQRIYTKENTQPPPQGTQIFCGNLPNSMSEIELFPYFALIGEIYEFRLMMEFSGFSRGFCFVTYMREESAERAVRNLHGYILKDKALHVYMSWDNSRLFIHGIPLSLSINDMSAELHKHFVGITNILFKNGDNGSEHRGWAFLQFDTHRNASIARKEIWPRKLMAWGSEITVEWARPERDANCILSLSNLPPAFTKVDVYNHIHYLIEIGSLVQINKMVGETESTLVFNTPQKAKNALKGLRGIVINGIIVYVSKMKPNNLSKDSQLNSSLQTISSGSHTNTSNLSRDAVNASIESTNLNNNSNSDTRVSFMDYAGGVTNFHDNPHASVFADPEFYHYNSAEIDKATYEQLNNADAWIIYDAVYNQMFSDDPHYRPSLDPNFNLARQFVLAYREISNSLFRMYQ